MSLNPDEILNNRYRIATQLGQGGFGAVYQAEDLSLNKMCAIKENLDYWDEARLQFEREARILSGLQHPSLPRVLDYFVIPEQGQYLVMDFVEGYDLQTVIDRVGKPLAERRVLEWVDQICGALAYLHSQNPPIVHRDVKPANIKITAKGRAVLVDFGIAKIYDPDLKTSLAARAVTPGFSPVEQYGDGTTDIRSDIYAIGATIYVLLTGQRPPESISRVTGEVLLTPREINPALSPHVEKAILRALQILATDRYASVEEFRRALKGIPAGALSIMPLTAQQTGRVFPLGAGALNKQFPGSASAPLVDTNEKKVSPASHRLAVKLEWVNIPAGEFLFGEERIETFLSAFQIARFPVTNRQYAHFLAANPQRPSPTHWRGRNSPVGKERHPVVGISFYDATAFCEWLDYRLPTEEEWEKAARGCEGYDFPWGQDWEEGKYCNNWDAGIGGTTPVDKYPEGASPFGVWDMVGNAWEWTASERHGPHMHIVRGGSWRLFSRFAMLVTQRDWLTLDDVRDDLSFRCARTI